MKHFIDLRTFLISDAGCYLPSNNGPESDSSELTVSILALIISVLALVLTLYLNWKLASKNKEHREAIFHLERNAQVEGRLAEWSDALSFYGIDLSEAETNNVSKEQIAYLVMSINSNSAMAKASKLTVYDYLIDNDYRKRMFMQEPTLRTWKYAKNCFYQSTISDIDKFIQKISSQT